MAEEDAPPPQTQHESTCVICFEQFENAGNHQASSLLCGHLFGKACIKQWMRTRQLCPICNKPAKLKDVRPVFGATKLVVQDVAEKERLRDENIAMKRKLRETELAMTSLTTQYELISRQCERLQEKKRKLTKAH
eukprot:Rmarinus@m.2541